MCQRSWVLPSLLQKQECYNMPVTPDQHFECEGRNQELQAILPLFSKLKAKQGDLVLKQKKEACDPHKEAGGFYRPAWATELDSISSNKITKKIIIRSEWPTCFWNGIKWVFLCWQNSWAQALPLLQPPKKVGIQAPLNLPEVCVWSTACTAPPPADLRSAPRTHVQGLTIACNPGPLGCLAHCTPVYIYVLTFTIKIKMAL